MSVTGPRLVLANVALLRGEAERVDAYRSDLIALLLTRVSATRIADVWDDAWQNPTTGRIYSAITIQADGGIGPATGERALTNTSQGRSLIRCWASFTHDRELIASLVSRILFPDEPGLGSMFIAEGTFVEATIGISEPDIYQEPGSTFRNALQMRATQRYRRKAHPE